MILKSYTFILHSRGYGKAYYENKRKEEMKNKNKKIKEINKYEKDNSRFYSNSFI